MNKLLPAAVCLLALCACSHQGSDQNEAAFPVQKVSGLDMSEIHNSSTTWRLKTPSAQILEKSGKAMLASPEIEFMEKNEVVSRITASRSELMLDTKDMVMEDNVVARSLRDKTTLETSLLRYSPSRKKIYTEKEVLITQNGTRMKGHNFEANPDLSEISLENQVALLAEDKP
ncbi:MAG: LPS export ABC transporter periplasmic protein LptC [Elusimicrobia bacterium]|nr:LPS export ABC transporter periplasmic protein LptC [Elusimicrobiota bacterium]